jgi:cellulose biosynthesis protein BcsQ
MTTGNQRLQSRKPQIISTIHKQPQRWSENQRVRGCVQMRNRQLDGSHRLLPTPPATQIGIYTKQVFNTAIPRNVDIRDAHFARKYIFSFNSSAKAAHAYNKLIDELFPDL